MNSDVSRLTYLIREIVDESLTWLRDPNGAMFDEKIIIPIINVIKSYLDKCLYSKNPDNVKLNTKSDDESESDNESADSELEHQKMQRTGRILGTIATLKSKKYRKQLSEYIASRIPLHKTDDTKSKRSVDISDNNTNNNLKKVIKKPIDTSDSDTDHKPKKVIKKKKPIDTSDSDTDQKPIDTSDSDTDQKPKKVIKKKKPVNTSDSDTDQKLKKVTKKKIK